MRVKEKLFFMVQATGVAFEDRPTSRSTRHMMAGTPLRTLRFLCLKLFNTWVKTGAAVFNQPAQVSGFGPEVVPNKICTLNKHRREKHHVCFKSEPPHINYNSVNNSKVRYKHRRTRMRRIGSRIFIQSRTGFSVNDSDSIIHNETCLPAFIPLDRPAGDGLRARQWNCAWKTAGGGCCDVTDASQLARAHRRLCFSTSASFDQDDHILMRVNVLH